MADTPLPPHLAERRAALLADPLFRQLLAYAAEPFGNNPPGWASRALAGIPDETAKVHQWIHLSGQQDGAMKVLRILGYEE